MAVLLQLVLYRPNPPDYGCSWKQVSRGLPFYGPKSWVTSLASFPCNQWFLAIEEFHR